MSPVNHRGLHKGCETQDLRYEDIQDEEEEGKEERSYTGRRGGVTVGGSVV